jgi:predicted N-acetyltransferase YhbS
MTHEAPIPAAGIENRALVPADLPAAGALHEIVFGPGRFARTAYRVREGTPPITPFCRGAFAGTQLIACLRLTQVAIGESRPHLLLGPLAVTPQFAGQGYGKALVSEALADARAAGIGVVVLVGDLPYYGRFGFGMVQPGQIVFPGPVNPMRILAVELRTGAMAEARGMVSGG